MEKLLKSRKICISVIGSHDSTPVGDELAHEVGKIVAKVGGILICGGLKGVMESASRGAREEGGLTIGLLPGKDKKDANPFIDIALPTSIGYARNALVACSADIVIALPGSHGTNSEICYALVFDRPVIDLGGWNIKGMIKLKSVKDLEAKLKELIKKID